MSSIQPRKQPANQPKDNLPLNNNNEEVRHRWDDSALDKEQAPVKLTPKEQFKYGDAKVTSPGVGRVSITIH
jgi:hypothetical protein